MKIAYFGHDFFSTCLKKILESNFNVYKVFSFETDNTYSFNNYIFDICQEHDLPLSFEKVSTKTIQQLDAAGCDLIITATYQHRIPDLSETGMRGINIHPSLLPVGRGPWSLPRTIHSQQTETGVTIHKLSHDFDAGDILFQQKLDVSDRENLESLSSKLQICAKDVIIRVLNTLDDYWISAVPQPSNVEYWPMPEEQERTLNWSAGVETIDRVVRAFGKFDSLASFDDKDWLVNDVSVWQCDHNEKIGSVVHKTNTEMVVAASDGLVSMRYFRPNIREVEEHVT